MNNLNHEMDDTEQKMKRSVLGGLRHRTGNLNGKMVWLLVGFVVMLWYGMFTTSGMGGFMQYIDPPTFLFIILLAAVSLVFTGMGKSFCRGVRFSFSKRIDGVSRMELQKAINAIKFCKNILFLEAGIMTAISAVDILYHMDAPWFWGPPLAVTGLSLLYAFIGALFLACVLGRLDGLLISYMEEPADEETQDDSQTIYFKLRAIGLTDREAEVARLVSCDMTNKEIGQMLYISDTTVKKHITHILDKTRLEDREKLSEMIRGL